MKAKKALAANIEEVVQSKLSENGEQPKTVKKAIKKSADKLAKKLTKLFKAADKKIKKAKKAKQDELKNASEPITAPISEEIAPSV